MILITGATGFVGGALLRRLAAEESAYRVRAAVRRVGGVWPEGVEPVVVADLDAATDWRIPLAGVEVVVHMAARVHIMNDGSADPVAEFRRVNVEGTRRLARQAAEAGVKRFIYMSSIKVNGEFTEPGCPFTNADVPAPADPYGISKHEAEQALWHVAAETGMEVVVIRPPLVYGPGVKANFGSMMRWLARGVPLPFAGVSSNRRSLVALDNLVDLVVVCLGHPAAAHQTFLVSDGEDISTADLMRRMGRALGRPSRVFYMPLLWLKWGAVVLNKPGLYQRLCGSLQLDIERTRQMLDWSPPLSVDEGLRRAAEGLRI